MRTLLILPLAVLTLVGVLRMATAPPVHRERDRRLLRPQKGVRQKRHRTRKDEYERVGQSGPDRGRLQDNLRGAVPEAPAKVRASYSYQARGVPREPGVRGVTVRGGRTLYTFFGLPVGNENLRCEG